MSQPTPPPTPRPDEFGDYTETLKGTFDDVLRAKRYELIDGSIYEEVIQQFTA